MLCFSSLGISLVMRQRLIRRVSNLGNLVGLPIMVISVSSGVIHSFGISVRPDFLALAASCCEYRLFRISAWIVVLGLRTLVFHTFVEMIFMIFGDMASCPGELSLP